MKGNDNDDNTTTTSVVTASVKGEEDTTYYNTIKTRMSEPSTTILLQQRPDIKHSTLPTTTTTTTALEVSRSADTTMTPRTTSPPVLPQLRQQLEKVASAFPAKSQLSFLLSGNNYESAQTTEYSSSPYRHSSNNNNNNGGGGGSDLPFSLPRRQTSSSSQFLNRQQEHPSSQFYNSPQPSNNSNYESTSGRGVAAAAPTLLPQKTCAYKNHQCEQPCAVKRNGQLHTLCDEHRRRQNAAQKRSDARRRACITERRRLNRQMQRKASAGNPTGSAATAARSHLQQRDVRAGGGDAYEHQGRFNAPGSYTNSTGVSSSSNAPFQYGSGGVPGGTTRGQFNPSDNNRTSFTSSHSNVTMGDTKQDDEDSAMLIMSIKK